MHMGSLQRFSSYVGLVSGDIPELRGVDPVKLVGLPRRGEQSR